MAQTIDLGNVKTNLMFNLPIAMKAQLEQLAEEKDVPTAQLVRQIVADAIGYQLPAEGVSRVKKYANEAERKAAQKAKEKSRRQLIKSLLEKYRKGEIDVAALETMASDVDDDEDDGEEEEDAGK